jgi:hypothetical protein
MNWFQGSQATATGQPPANPNPWSWMNQGGQAQGAYSPQMVQGARGDLLAQLGMGLMAAGQPMSGAQRAQYLAQLGQAPAQYQQDLALRLAAQQKAELYQQQQAFAEVIKNSTPEQRAALGIPEGAAEIYKSLPAASLVDITEKGLTSKIGGGSDMGMQLQYWETRNDDGTTTLHAGQLMPGGGVKEVQLPPNSQWSPTQHYLDTGTTFQGMPTRGGVPGPTVQKNVAEEAAQKETGKSQAEVKQLLPAAESATNDATALIDNLLADQNGMEWAVGASSGYGALIPGTPGYDYAARVNNLKGKVFLQAYQQLRGAGAITEQEGKAATEAIANLDMAQGEPQFQQALIQLRDVLARGYQNLRAKAGIGAAPPAGAPGKTLTYNPQTGELE